MCHSESLSSYGTLITPRVEQPYVTQVLMGRKRGREGLTETITRSEAKEGLGWDPKHMPPPPPQQPSQKEKGGELVGNWVTKGKEKKGGRVQMAESKTKMLKRGGQEKDIGQSRQQKIMTLKKTRLREESGRCLTTNRDDQRRVIKRKSL